MRGFPTLGGLLQYVLQAFTALAVKFSKWIMVLFRSETQRASKYTCAAWPLVEHAASATPASANGGRRRGEASKVGPTPGAVPSLHDVFVWLVGVA